MRTNSALFVIFSFLALFWGLKIILGLGSGPAQTDLPPGSTGKEGATTRNEKIQALLSGEFKRQPKKNPDVGLGRLRCAVRTPDGAPAARAVVQVMPCDPKANMIEPRPEYPHFWEAVADERGQVEFRTLPAGDFMVMATRKGEHGLAQVSIRENGSFGEAMLDLWPNHPRTGIVKDVEGAPIAGAWIVPIYAVDWHGDSDPYRHVPTQSGADGRFEHPLLPEGSWQLLAIAPGYAPALVLAGEDGKYEALLGMGEALKGRVMREDNGRPINNAKVELVASDRPAERYTTRANGQGYFSFEKLRDAPYDVHLVPGDYGAAQMINVSTKPEDTNQAATPASRNMKIDPLTGVAVATDASALVPAAGGNVAKEREVVELLAHAMGGVRGRVFESGIETGVAGAEFSLYRGDEQLPAATASSDQAGYYHLKSLEPGTYHIVATRSPGHVFLSESASNEVTIESGKLSSGPEFREVESVSLVGQALDSTGSPLSEANIFIQIQGRPGEPLRFGSDSEGRFDADGFHANDQVVVWAEKMGGLTGKFGPVTIGESGLRDIMLRATQEG